ncbi:hypothetical protein [Telmatospirillum siberiense]|uniref:Holin n=1 Tax=Telmatospirillum siberiense TaxID=382514 RepID=A0A2N3PNP1_9PROT|nr:hypothetical protein [Telmatospirillum siberiense]PKU22016.1 hypothetical protein CWS72_23705 [Telmatospirillum siberiense]
MSRFWLVLFPFVIWSCAAYTAWRIYEMVAIGGYANWTDIVKLLAALVTAIVAQGQAQRRYDERQQAKRALREWAEEDELKSGKSDV